MQNRSLSCCKLCEGKTYPKYTITWNGLEKNILECQDCGFHFLNYLDDVSDSTSVLETISEEQFNYIERSLQGKESRFAWQTALVWAYVAGEAPRILDVGSGGGKFLALMRERGAVPMGIEPNGVRAAFARRHYHMETDQRLVGDSYWQKGYAASFDGLCFWDVIEHVNDPKRLLDDAVKLISPGGFLFIDTPMRESIYYRLGALSYRLSGGRQPLFLRSLYSPTPNAHKQIFTQRQLVGLLEQQGMKLVKQEVFHELSFPYSFYLQRLVKSQRLASVLSPIASAFFSVFRIRNKMLLVARKPEIKPGIC